MDYKMTTLPYAYRFSPQRWRYGTNIMLEKKPGIIFVNKLRAILLYEADFNFSNKILGCQAMYYAEAILAMAKRQSGSRKEHTAIDQGLNKQLRFDLLHLECYPGALCSNDAKSCYDHIVHAVARICSQRLGTPTEPIV
jgi:hypothetical protein